MIGFFTEGRACVTPLASHTTEIFQVFDVTFFNVLERYPRCKLPFGDEEVTVEFLLKTYHGFKQMTGDSNRWKTFQALVFEFETGNE
jgi:hypothetical protein